MKKLVVLLGVVAIGTSIFVGCGNNVSKKVETQKQEQKQESKSKIFSIGDTVKTKDFNITVNKVEISNEEKTLKPADGNEFLKVNITVENTSDKLQSISSVMMFKIMDSKGKAYDQAFTDDKNEPLIGDIEPKEKITGEYIVEVPKGINGLKLDFNSSLLNGKQVIVNLN